MRFATTILALSALCAPAFGLEVRLFQRGYIEGGTTANTTLTDAAVAAFEQQNPEIDVKIVGVPWSREGDLKLRTALLARKRIDCFRLAHDELPAYLPSGGRLLAPVTPELRKEDRADYGETALQAVTYDGEVMAWPLWSTAMVMIANRALLEQAGVEVPLDRPMGWDEFTALLERLRSAGSQADPPFFPLNAAARPPSMEWAPLLLAHCGPLFQAATPGGPREPAPGLAGALEHVAALRLGGLLAPSFGVDDLPAAQETFLQGRVALMITSLAFLRDLPKSGIDFCILPPPTGDYGRPITHGGMGCFAVVESGNPERIAAAHKLARFLTGEAAADAVPGWFLAPPVRRSIRSFYANPVYAPLAPIMSTVDYPLSPYGAGFMEGSFIPRLQGAILGQQTPDEAIAGIREASSRQH